MTGRSFSRGTRRAVAAWDELCPDGAWRFYEGDNPEGFAAEIKETFGFDPSEDPDWDKHVDDGRGGFPMRGFFVPAGLVGAVYGSGRWELGS
jgi:hypothetical protein